jgi:hypothetical protein
MPTFDVNAARQSGATDDQILSYLSQGAPNFDVQGALKQSSKPDVINYLASHSGPPVTLRPDFSLNPPGVPRPTVNMEMSPFGKGYQGPGANDNPGSFEGHPENIGEYIPASAGQMVKGFIDQQTPGNYARGTHEMLSGAANAALPVLPFFLAGAPLATGATLAAGQVGQFAGQKAGEAVGLNPDQAALAGDVGGLAGGYAGAKLPGFLGRIQAPLGNIVTKPRGAVPAEQYTPADLKAYADQNGIPLTAAQATQHNLPLNLQSAGERASVGGTALRQQVATSQAAIAQHAENLMNSVSPRTPDLATAGSTIQSSVVQALAREQLASRQDYAAIDQQAGNVGVDLRPVKQSAQQLLSDSDFVRKLGALDPKKASAILEAVADAPSRASFSEAQQLRSALLDASRTPELAISNQAQGWIKQLTGATDAQMMAASKSQPGLEPAFRAANDRWTQLQEDFNNPRSPLAQILQEPDPSKVPQKLMQRGQIGGSPYNAQLLDRYGIDKGPVKWSILSDLVSKDFRLSNKTLGGYSDDFLQSVFSPPELEEIYKTGAIARSVGLNTNPSGTAAVSGAMADVQRPVRSLGPKAIAAKLTKSPGFNQRMMTPARPVPAPSRLAPLIGASQAPDDDEEFWSDPASWNKYLPQRF